MGPVLRHNQPGLLHDCCLTAGACGKIITPTSSPWAPESGVFPGPAGYAPQHGQALLAFNIYDWMRTPAAQGGAGLRPTVFTYTAAMRAALAGNLIDRALKVAMLCLPHVLLCAPALSWAVQTRVNDAAPVCSTTMAHRGCRCRITGRKLRSQGTQALWGFMSCA